jgi:hypothetical protein
MVRLENVAFSLRLTAAELRRRADCLEATAKALVEKAGAEKPAVPDYPLTILDVMDDVSERC